MINFNFIARVTYLLAITGLTISCGTQNNNAASNNTASLQITINKPLQIGYLLDSAVEGVSYTVGGDKKLTGNDGSFEYYGEELIEFTIGDVSLGKVLTPSLNTLFINYPVNGPSGYILTPLSLTPDAVNNNDPRVVNKLRFLQSLDADGDPENGILITEDVASAVQGWNIDFSLSTEEFSQSDFNSLIDYLNSQMLFDSNMPRTLQSDIEALRHFNKLFTFLTFNTVTETYISWWQMDPECDNNGKSLLKITNSNVSFCPDINGLYGCYEGVELQDGTIVLPEITPNALCQNEFITAQHPEACNSATSTRLSSNLVNTNNTISGEFEVVCNISNPESRVMITADFVKAITESDFSSSSYSSQLATYLSSLKNDVVDLIGTASCSNDTQCRTTYLKSSFYCDPPIYYAYSTENIDLEKLLFKQNVYTDVADLINNSYEHSGLTICMVSPQPVAQCVNSTCRLYDIFGNAYQNQVMTQR
ncbi:MAG: hypothetical protein OQK70_02495 [Gammaproteobacteria bacterium]|nr:hypothetical protein [Gammaproteobacteria bacterium]